MLVGFFWVLFFEIGSHCVAQINFKLAILLPKPPECWDSRLASPCLVFSDVNIYLCRLQLWQESWEGLVVGKLTRCGD
jgi:hypothetical protein